MVRKSLPLVQALAWIVVSMLCTSLVFATWKWNRSRHKEMHREDCISWIVQTSPQKQALSTSMLAEMLGLSRDHPVRSRGFSTKSAEKRLRSFPFVEDAHVFLRKPNTLYVDYTLRRPVAYVEDFENLAVDVHGFLFPMTPFYKPVALPCFYFGFAPFGESPKEKEAPPTAAWRESIQGKHFSLALTLLALIQTPTVKDAFLNPRIDVSHAMANSAAKREIVLQLEDVETRKVGNKDVQLRYPRIVRLSTTNFAQELGNYLKLRERLLLAEAQRKIEARTDSVRMSPIEIDLRIANLGFVKNL